MIYAGVIHMWYVYIFEYMTCFSSRLQSGAQCLDILFRYFPNIQSFEFGERDHSDNGILFPGRAGEKEARKVMYRW